MGKRAAGASACSGWFQRMTMRRNCVLWLDEPQRNVPRSAGRGENRSWADDRRGNESRSRSLSEADRLRLQLVRHTAHVSDLAAADWPHLRVEDYIL